MNHSLAGVPRFVVLVCVASLLGCNGPGNAIEPAEVVDLAAGDGVDGMAQDWVDFGKADLDSSGSDQVDLNVPDSSDMYVDGLDVSEVVLPKKVLEWQAFGESHVMLSIDNSVLWCDETHFCWDEWVSRYEVTLTRTGGTAETILSGKVANNSWNIWPERLTEVVAIAASPDESVRLCFLLYDPDDSLFSSGCQERTLVPGTYGQVLWQLSTTTCQTQPYLGCFQPLAGSLSPERTRDGDTPTLFYAFTLGENAGVPSPGTSVSLSFAPPPTCEVALAWFRETVIDDPGIAFHSCHQPPDGSYQWSGARLEMPTAEAAMGLFNEILSLPQGVPAAILWEAVFAQNVAADDFLVGASYGQLGTAQAQYECEVWMCQ